MVKKILILTFDFLSELRVRACRGPAMDYRSTEFGVNSFSGFPFRAQTDKQTDATKCSIPRWRLYSQCEIKVNAVNKKYLVVP